MNLGGDFRAGRSICGVYYCIKDPERSNRVDNGVHLLIPNELVGCRMYPFATKLCIFSIILDGELN